MRRTAIAVVIAASCGGKSGHLGELAVWDRAAPDGGTPLVVPFDDGTNGTELVIRVLSRARATGATAFSGFTIQVGRCTREVAVAPRPVVQPEVPGADLDPITMRMRETRYRCETHMDQGLIPDPKDPESDLHETELNPIDSCAHDPVEHVVTRYRFEVDHTFTPPDWAMLRDWTHLDLRFGPPRCEAPAPSNVARLVVHTGGRGETSDPPQWAMEPPAAERARAVVELAARARRIADRDGQEAAALARQALDAWDDGSFTDELDDADANALAGAVAAAMFVATAPEVGELELLTAGPINIDAAWAVDVGAKIDALAARYQRIGDLVRLAPAEEFLRAGAGRLAAIHRHVAEKFDAARMPNAAAAERAKAVALDHVASGH